MRVDLDAIDRMLHESGASDCLLEVFELLDGAIVDRMTAREAATQAWERARSQPLEPRLVTRPEQSRVDWTAQAPGRRAAPTRRHPLSAHGDCACQAMPYR